MSVSKANAQEMLKNLREVLAAHGLALKMGFVEAKETKVQAQFYMTVAGAGIILDQYLTGEPVSQCGCSDTDIVAFCVGVLRTLIFKLADERSSLILRYPTKSEPLSVTLGAYPNPELSNREVQKRWRAIDTMETRTTEFQP